MFLVDLEFHRQPDERAVVPFGRFVVAHMEKDVLAEIFGVHEAVFLFGVKISNDTYAAALDVEGFWERFRHGMHR